MAPICGDGKYRSLGVGDSLVGLGGGFDLVGDVDCPNCWEKLVEIYFHMRKMRVTTRELEKKI
jgi:hypothetical protein